MGVQDFAQPRPNRAKPTVDGCAASGYRADCPKRAFGFPILEFAYIFKTFPLVLEPVKVAALNGYRDVERGLIQ